MVRNLEVPKKQILLTSFIRKTRQVSEVRKHGLKGTANSNFKSSLAAKLMIGIKVHAKRKANINTFCLPHRRLLLLFAIHRLDV